MTVTYHVGDTREVIKTIPDGSVDLIASSPPFLALRSYVPADHESKGDEIGSEANPSAFIDMLLGLTAEWGRVLAAHGSIAIELGDTYSAGARDTTPKFIGANDGAFKFDRTSGRLAPGGQPYADTFKSGGPGGEGWPRAKSLALIPQLYAIALAYGINPLTGAPSPAGRWLVRNVIVWHRPNPAVGALGDKVRPSTSYIVIATRSPKRWFDLTAVRTPFVAGNNGGAGGVSSLDGGTRMGPRNVERLMTHAGAPPLDAWFDQYDGTHDTWTLTTQPSRLAHYAMWPAKLAERLILSMCPREVCRICGEPRRRMEESTYIPHGDVGKQHAEARVLAMATDRGIHGTAQSMVNGRATKVPTTLGWTDCGHQCPTCGGTKKVWGPGGVIYGTTVEACPNCTDGRAFRPGFTLDPFAGSGTTLAVADLHGRDAIGIDFDARNKAISPARYDEVKRALFGTPAPMPGQGDLFADEVPA